MTDSIEGMKENVAKGRGIVRKDGFKVIGQNENDRKHYEFTGEKDKRGRPVKDQDWRIVGKEGKEADKQPSGD